MGKHKGQEKKNKLNSSTTNQKDEKSLFDEFSSNLIGSDKSLFEIFGILLKSLKRSMGEKKAIPISLIILLLVGLIVYGLQCHLAKIGEDNIDYEQDTIVNQEVETNINLSIDDTVDGTEVEQDILIDDEKRSDNPEDIPEKISDEDALLTIIEESYPDWEICPSVELVSYDQLFLGEPEKWIENCRKSFKAEIIDRQYDVELKDRMPLEYIENVKSANEIYDNLGKVKCPEEKAKLCEEATDERTDAKNYYRNESNEAIIGNYFVKRSKVTFEEEPDGAYKFNMLAINYYYDAYAVSSVKQTYKYKALNYAGTCYYNIGQSNNLSIEARMQAYMFSIALIDEYRFLSGEDKIALNHTVGSAYMKLCELAEDESVKYFFNRKAEEEFEKDFNNPDFGKKSRRAAAKELVYVEQYCLDNINDIVYGDETRKSIKSKHDMYERML